jgi:hypothetical protein
MGKIEAASNSIKPLLNDLENLLEVNGLYKEFVALNGLTRLQKVLDREEKRNR